MTTTWQLYEKGIEYQQRLGRQAAARENEKFYLGDQWHRNVPADLPKPVFNVIRRVVDYLVSAVAADRYSVTYTDNDLPYRGGTSADETVRAALGVLSANAAYRWEKCHMDSLVYKLLLDAAITGDGVAYCYWNQGDRAGIWNGDIAVETLPSTGLFVADPDCPDIQSQDYVILSGRATVESLRREAIENGLGGAAAAKILSDGAGEGEDGKDDGKATYLILFRREGGKVIFEKSVRELLLRRVETDCSLYPVALLHWNPSSGIYGTAPVGEMIPNQKFINLGYAMMMKHMTDTAFSKVVYDKSRIPEWTNAVGEAIGVVGAANVADAVSVIEPGRMQDGCRELVESAISTTKEIMGATETALGNVMPTNTSAILALRETSKLSLGRVGTALCRCLEDIADIWLDMMCAYYPDDRLLPIDKGGNLPAKRVDFPLLRRCLIRAHVTVSESERFGASATVTTLDKLLDGGHITAAQYLENLPAGILPGRDEILRTLGAARKEGKEENE